MKTMKSKRRISTVLSTVLSISMLAGVLSTTALAVEATEQTATVSLQDTSSDKFLGTTKLANPVQPTSTTNGWRGSYVYYGKYINSKSNIAIPNVKYRVLSRETTSYGAEKTMLLDSDILVDGHTLGAANWSNSSIKTSLTTIYNSEQNFTTAERSAIAPSIGGLGVPLTGEYIFLLSGDELLHKQYGYPYSWSATPSRQKQRNGTNSRWWTRGTRTYSVMALETTGELKNAAGGQSQSMGFSPAFNVKLNSILFANLVTGTAGQVEAEYKLTLLNNEMNTTIIQEPTRYTNDNITFVYQVSGTKASETTELALMVLDKEYTEGNTNNAELLAYYKLKDLNSSENSGTVDVQLTDVMKTNKEYCYLVAVDDNDEKNTNYATQPIKLTIPDGKCTMDTDGTVTLPDGKGTIKVPTTGSKVNENGSVTTPGNTTINPDGTITLPNGDKITPNKNEDGENAEVDSNGNVTLPNGGTKVNSEGTTDTIEPDSIVNADGTVIDLNLGDVNGDGSVNMKDLALLQEYLAELPVTIVEKNSDMDEDGKINMKDLSLLQQKLVES